MATPKKGKYIEKFLKRADEAIQEGIKRADEALEDAVEFGEMTTKQAANFGKEIHTQAHKEKESIQRKGMEKINKSISAAKNARTNTQEDLEVLEKLGNLRKAGVITEKEFQANKKKILGRI